jgi:SWI/SNF-related matrix-associated actin-dependent regulator of chromatin subfamily A member 5
VARGVNCKAKLLLSGTPLQNNLHELWSLLNFLLPDIFDDNKIFDELFVGKLEGFTPEEIEKKNSEILIQLHKIISPFILRFFKLMFFFFLNSISRLKTEVNLNLPPKKEIHIYVGLTPLQHKMYKEMIIHRSVNGEGGSKTTFANICMQLKKICDHPYLFDGIEVIFFYYLLLIFKKNRMRKKYGENISLKLQGKCCCWISCYES